MNRSVLGGVALVGIIACLLWVNSTGGFHMEDFEKTLTINNEKAICANTIAELNQDDRRMKPQVIALEKQLEQRTTAINNCYERNTELIQQFRTLDEKLSGIENSLMDLNKGVMDLNKGVLHKYNDLNEMISDLNC